MIPLTRFSCKLVYASFGHVDQFSTQAIQRYKQALEEAERGGIKIKALVLTNPHNPLGTAGRPMLVIVPC